VVIFYNAGVVTCDEGRIGSRTGLPDFSWYNTYTNAGKNTPNDYKITNAHKIFRMVVKYYKCPEYITTFSIPRSSEIYPNLDFWSEK
jgi:hypothetical protein